MKSLKKFPAFLLILVLMFSANFVSGQPSPQRQKPAILNIIPNLTEDQKTKIQELHTQMLEKNNPLKAQLKVKQAELKQLLVSDDATMQQKQAKLKEIYDLKYQIQLNRIEMQSQVRALLNDEQKAVYDNHILNGRKHKNKQRPVRGKPMR